MTHFRKTYCEIDLDAIKHNYQFVRNSFGSHRWISPMVKANAYGHGDIQVTQALIDAGAQSVGVCLIEEGLKLRSLYPDIQILVYNPFDQQGAKAIIDASLTPVISKIQQIEMLAHHAIKPLSIHLKINTGMNRLGFNFDQIPEIKSTLDKYSRIHVEGVLSHLSYAEDSLDKYGFSAMQAKKLTDAVNELKLEKHHIHLLNSAGILNAIQCNDGDHYLKKYEWGLRPGIMIYGSHPMDGSSSLFKKAMTLKSHIELIRYVKAHESVSYSQRWTAQRASVVGVVPIGYADGIHRSATNACSVFINNKKVPIIGTVCMDFVMVDLTQFVDEGQDSSSLMNAEVEIFGKNISADEWASHLKTISYEIFTSVGVRVPRVYKSGS